MLVGSVKARVKSHAAFFPFPLSFPFVDRRDLHLAIIARIGFSAGGKRSTADRRRYPLTWRKGCTLRECPIRVS